MKRYSSLFHFFVSFLLTSKQQSDKCQSMLQVANYYPPNTNLEKTGSKIPQISYSLT